MFLRHGGLTLELPDGWVDRSTLLFVGPPPSDARSLHPVDQGNEALSVTFTPTDGRTADEVAEEQSVSLRQMAERFEPHDVADVQAGLGPGRLHTWKVTLSADLPPLRQLVAAFVLGPVSVVATASAPEASFEQSRPRLLKAIQSLDATPQPGAEASAVESPGGERA